MDSTTTLYARRGRRQLVEARDQSFKASEAERRTAELQKTEKLRALRIAKAAECLLTPAAGL